MLVCNNDEHVNPTPIFVVASLANLCIPGKQLPQYKCITVILDTSLHIYGCTSLVTSNSVSDTGTWLPCIADINRSTKQTLERSQQLLTLFINKYLFISTHYEYVYRDILLGHTICIHVQNSNQKYIQITPPHGSSFLEKTRILGT